MNGVASQLRTVAVLCAAKRSVYKEIEGCDVYDIDRDAMTFPGGMPVVAHPPCRLWSAYCAHQAKAKDPWGEKALGVWCAERVQSNGGVLEQPAHSRLWDECGLPKPGQPGNSALKWSLEVPQYWFGDSREKATWLLFVGIVHPRMPEIPFRLKGTGGDRRIWQLMSSKNQRERTPRAFAGTNVLGLYMKEGHRFEPLAGNASVWLAAEIGHAIQDRGPANTHNRKN